MTNQKIITASEPSYGILPLTSKILSKLPPILALEAEEFLKNNKEHSVKGHYCSRCLKAHLIKKIKERQLNNYRNAVDEVITEQIGHDGYYIDGEELLHV